MEEERVYNGGCIREAFKGFLRCLGLESGGREGEGVADDDEIVVADNTPPPQPPLDPTTTTTYESLPSVDESSTVDPLVEVLSPPIDSVATIMEINKNPEDESNFALVTIDEIINSGGGTTNEAHFVELIEGNNTFITASLISSGGGGKTHSTTI